MTQTHIPPQFTKRVFAMLNAHGWDTGHFYEEGVRLFEKAWIPAEGGTAQWNPLNCTLTLLGVTAYNTFGTGMHVWNYKRPVDGCCATAMSLANGLYPGILGDLQNGVKTAEQIVTDRRAQFVTWGTNPDLILQLLKENPA